MEMQSFKYAGFTLVELMMVVVIIAILAGTVSLSVMNHLAPAYKTRITADFRAISDAVKLFRLHTGSYPETLSQLQFGDDIKGWHGPYLEPPPMDPWGKPYFYEVTPESIMPFELKTLGADGQEDGIDENKDYRSSELFGKYANK